MPNLQAYTSELIRLRAFVMKFDKDQRTKFLEELSVYSFDIFNFNTNFPLLHKFVKNWKSKGQLSIDEAFHWFLELAPTCVYPYPIPEDDNHSADSFRCHYCHNYFKTRPLIVRHYREVHTYDLPKNILSSVLFTCIHCDVSFKRKCHYNSHLNSQSHKEIEKSSSFKVPSIETLKRSISQAEIDEITPAQKQTKTIEIPQTNSYFLNYDETEENEKVMSDKDKESCDSSNISNKINRLSLDVSALKLCDKMRKQFSFP